MLDDCDQAQPSSKSSRTRSLAGENRKAARRLIGILLAALITIPTGMVLVSGSFGFTGDTVGPLALPISIDVVRTGPSEASVIGFTDGAGDSIDVVVNGQVAATGTVSWIGEYWILRVPVTDGASVKTRIGLVESPTVTVPDHVAQKVGPPGFIYTQGSRMFRDGSPISLTGVDEATAFSYALLTWGYDEPQDAGKNQLFPSGPDTQIPGITTPDELWREYFRYFLHYQQSTDPGSPAPNLLRIWIADLNWGPFAYDVWEEDPSTFYEIFDRMLYWADRAGVYIVPVIGQNSIGPADNAYYDRSSSKYARHLAFARDLMEHYDSNPTIAMWDLWNEADVLNDVYWATVGGITGYRSWMAGLVGDLRAYSANHPFTLGSAQWPDLPGLPTPFGVRRHFLFNKVAGLDVAHEHAYFGVEDQYLIDWRAEWGKALGIPYFVGEYGYNGRVLNPLGYGHWPWFTRQWRAADVGPLSAMVWLDNGKGAFADYPYFGALPDYPPEDPGSNRPPSAAFVYFPAAPKVGETVRFDGSSATDDSGIVGYAWTFGDGQAGTGRLVDHVYGSAGTYAVTLTVQDAAGASDSVMASLLVSPGGLPPNEPPQAAFASSPLNPHAGDPVQFDASASTDDRGIVSFVWDFGDGHPGVGKFVMHAYTTSGRYNVTLTVRDAEGASDTARSPVDVDSAPIAPHPRVTFASWDPERRRLDISFSASMNRSSVEENLRMSPATTSYAVEWENDTRLFLVLEGSGGGPSPYVAVIAGTATDASGHAMVDPFTFAFDTLPTRPAPGSPGPFSAESPWLLLILGLSAGLIAMASMVRRSRRRRRAVLDAERKRRSAILDRDD